MKITANPTDSMRFKVPSLRNVAVTAPYMHDGRFGTLAAVMNHYQQGVVQSSTLDPILQQNGNLGISLSDEEKGQLIASAEAEVKEIEDQYKLSILSANEVISKSHSRFVRALYELGKQKIDKTNKRMTEINNKLR